MVKLEYEVGSKFESPLSFSLCWSKFLYKSTAQKILDDSLDAHLSKTVLCLITNNYTAGVLNKACFYAVFLVLFTRVWLKIGVNTLQLLSSIQS